MNSANEIKSEFVVTILKIYSLYTQGSTYFAMPKCQLSFKLKSSRTIFVISGV